jgi:hypothetical protein
MDSLIQDMLSMKTWAVAGSTHIMKNMHIRYI